MEAGLEFNFRKPCYDCNFDYPNATKCKLKTMKNEELKRQIFELIDQIDDFDVLLDYYSDFKQIVERSLPQSTNFKVENPVIY